MDAVTVRRMRVDCAVPRNHPNPLAVRTRLDEAAERLPAALAELLAPLAKAGDEVVVIPALELTFDLDTSLTPTDMARVWAARIAAAVATRLHPDARGTMLRFSDDAHYLARFLVDTVGGRASQTWYYRRWRGLSPLAVAAQLRSAILDEPARGLAALATLSRSELTTVLMALGPYEARRVTEALVAAYPGSDLEGAARALTPHVSTWLQVSTALPSSWQAGLALAAIAANNFTPTELSAAVSLAATVAAMARKELSSTSAPTAVAVLDGAGLPSAAPLLALSSDVRRALVSPLGTVSGDTPMAEPASWYTRLGGLLLLLPRLAELPFAALLGDKAGVARLLVLARAADPRYRRDVIEDSLWRHLCGVAEDADVDALAPIIATTLSRALWNRALGRAQRLRAVVTRHVDPRLVLASEPDGDWLGITPLTATIRHVLRSAPPIEYDGIELSADISHASAHAAASMLAWLEPTGPEDGIAIAAQHVLRAFARRLPGFTASSPRFLFDNFLDFDATIIESDDTFHCRVGRPRLAALFGLTGALRGRLPMGDGRALELYPA
jgi:hypothetical protein